MSDAVKDIFYHNIPTVPEVGVHQPRPEGFQRTKINLIQTLLVAATIYGFKRHEKFEIEQITSVLRLQIPQFLITSPVRYTVCAN